jgi:acetylornithine deacetylase/succinyl-diaminopimelate desuccinylase-like protein
MNRREFVATAAMAAAGATLPASARTQDSDLQPIWDQIGKLHDESVQRLQTWIRQPSIAAENRGMQEGCRLLMDMLRDAGFNQVTQVPTDGQPGVFATLDAGAPKTVGLYFMYDVKQVDPSEWSSPPFHAALVDKPGFGKVIVGRGAVNQKGPEATFLAALHAIRAAGRKPPVNFVFVAEGEEEIGSPHFPQVVRRPEVLAALKRCTGLFMPSASQNPDGAVTIDLGAKGVMELERRVLGTRSQTRRSLKSEGDDGQSCMASGGSAYDVGLSGRKYSCHRKLHGKGSPPICHRQADDRRSRAARRRSHTKAFARSGSLDQRCAVPAGA